MTSDSDQSKKSLTLSKYVDLVQHDLAVEHLFENGGVSSLICNAVLISAYDSAIHDNYLPGLLPNTPIEVICFELAMFDFFCLAKLIDQRGLDHNPNNAVKVFHCEIFGNAFIELANIFFEICGFRKEASADRMENYDDVRNPKAGLNEYATILYQYLVSDFNLKIPTENRSLDNIFNLEVIDMSALMTYPPIHMSDKLENLLTMTKNILTKYNKTDELYKLTD